MVEFGGNAKLCLRGKEYKKKRQEKEGQRKRTHSERRGQTRRWRREGPKDGR